MSGGEAPFTPETLRPYTTLTSLLSHPRGGYSFGITVRLGALGVTAPQALAAHASAPDGWEGDLRAIPASPSALTEFEPWLASARTIIEQGLARSMTRQPAA